MSRIHGVDDFPLVVQMKDIDDCNPIVTPYADDIIMVNAKVDAALTFSEQVVLF